MATKVTDKEQELEAELTAPEGAAELPQLPEGADVSAEEPDLEPARLGATRYVHAAFFGAGMLTAYLSGKLLAVFWNALAQWPAATRAVPQLLGYAEDERGSLAMLAGAVIGILAVIQTYRREGIRRWADEVAEELSRVVWPNREVVRNGTIVVLVAGAIATVYIALLDRFWGFLTTLVYGA